MIGKTIWFFYFFRIFLEPKVTTNQLTTCRLSKRHFYHVFLVNVFLTNKMALAVVNTANIMTVTDFFCHIIFVNWVRKFFTSFIHISFASKVKCKFSQVIVIESAKCNVRRRDTKKTCVGVAIFVLSSTFPNFVLFGKCSHEGTNEEGCQCPTAAIAIFMIEAYFDLLWPRDQAHCLKIIKNVSFEFFNLGTLHQFLPIKIDLPGTVWP